MPAPASARRPMGPGSAPFTKRCGHDRGGEAAFPVGGAVQRARQSAVPGADALHAANLRPGGADAGRDHAGLPDAGAAAGLRHPLAAGTCPLAHIGAGQHRAGPAAGADADRRHPAPAGGGGGGAGERHFLGAALVSALANLLFLAPTRYMLQSYDRVVPTRGGTTLAFLTLALLLAFATLSLLEHVRSRILVRASIGLDRRLARTLIAATLRQQAGEGIGRRSRQPIRECDQLRQTLTGPAMFALFAAPWTPIYILVCALIHPLIGLMRADERRFGKGCGSTCKSQ